jgi:hypothetical protein
MRVVRIRIGRLLGLVLVTGGLLLTAGAAADGGVSGDPRSARPVFVLDKGRFAAFDAPGAGAAEFPRINDRGQIVGRAMPTRLARATASCATLAGG